MVNYLLDFNADGYVLDYRFRDTLKGITYNGATLYKEISESKHEIPLIILTGQEDKMTESISDPYHVISKDLLENKPDLFAKKLLQLIKGNKKKTDGAEKRIKEILEKKKKKKLSLKEREELIELDTYLDKVVYKKDVVPETLKTEEVTKRLDNLLEKTELILKGIKKK